MRINHAISSLHDACLGDQASAFTPEIINYVHTASTNSKSKLNQLVEYANGLRGQSNDTNEINELHDLIGIMQTVILEMQRLEDKTVSIEHTMMSWTPTVDESLVAMDDVQSKLRKALDQLALVHADATIMTSVRNESISD
jgi:uncharacterized protein YkvS